MEDGSNLVLMHGYLNKEALKLSIETKQAHYWSRSREQLWKKGETSGLYQNIKEILVDDDQDCMIFIVEVEGSGASCHVGYKSCFYRSVESLKDLEFVEEEKLFDPKEVYEGQENPTKL
jgi:phosphoribosyl-AMP cyclohydrolase